MPQQIIKGKSFYNVRQTRRHLCVFIKPDNRPWKIRPPIIPIKSQA